MISEMQREALSVLAEVWALSPDVRLGQLMAHLGFLGEAHVRRSRHVALIRGYFPSLSRRFFHSANCFFSALSQSVADAPGFASMNCFFFPNGPHSFCAASDRARHS